MPASGDQARIDCNRAIDFAAHPLGELGGYLEPALCADFDVLMGQEIQSVQPARQHGICQHQQQQSAAQRRRSNPGTRGHGSNDQRQRRRQRDQHGSAGRWYNTGEGECHDT